MWLDQQLRVKCIMCSEQSTEINLVILDWRYIILSMPLSVTPPRRKIALFRHINETKSTPSAVIPLQATHHDAKLGSGRVLGKVNPIPMVPLLDPVKCGKTLHLQINLSLCITVPPPTLPGSIDNVNAIRRKRHVSSLGVCPMRPALQA